MKLRRSNTEMQGDRATDGELLGRFVDRQDNDAFAELIRRYGDLVMGLCRRTLGDEHNAEDAFQATFLVLAQRASRIQKHSSLAGWLHAVAYRTSLRARTKKHNRREQALLDEMTVSDNDLLDRVTSRHTQLLLDEELQQLTAKYREPLVLRYLMGRSNKDIAVELGLTVGVVEGRLKRGKDHLRQRLSRRGVSATLALTTVAASAGAATAAESLVVATVEAAAAFSTGGQLPSDFSQNAIRLSEQELTMRVSSLAAATSISAVAVVIVGIALAQDSAMGQRSAHGASTALTISSAASESEFGKATVILSEKMERNAESNEIKPTPVAEEKIKSALAERADFEFTDTPLQQAIAEIADRHQINVIIDTLALDEVGLEPDAAVTLGLSDTPLESSLHFMLRPLALTWTVYKGVLVITTPEEVEEMLITKVYGVGDLVRFQDKEGKEWSDYDTLIELITSAIQPDTWDVVGGAGAIEAAPFGNAAMLTVTHTYQAHGEIDDLLESFREITEKTNVQGLPFREQPTGGIMGGMGDDMGIVRRSTMQKES